jgi:hypothetical protein
MTIAAISVYSQYTLMELAKRTADGNLLEIAEVLNTSKELIQDAVWLQANQLNSHVGTRRTRLPAGTFRQANQGVTGDASSTRQISEPIARLEGHSKIDEAILNLSPNPQEARSQEDLAYVEGMGQTLETKFFYGNVAQYENEFDGMATRSDYNAINLANTQNSGGSGSYTTSLWIVEWGPRMVHFVYPKGSSAGLETKDQGLKYVTDDADATKWLFKWVTQFVINAGIFINDPRFVQRVVNIATASATGALNDNDIIAALNKMPKAGGGPTARIYVNRNLKTQFDILAKDKTNVNYFVENVFGEPMTIFRTVPIRLAEALTNQETALT